MARNSEGLLTSSATSRKLRHISWMDQNYPSLPISIKELRLLLRRINKSIRDLDSSLSESHTPLLLDPDSIHKLSDLIYSKALQKVGKNQNNFNGEIDEDPANILNELI